MAIEVFPDILPEAIQIRRKLKPVTAKLQEVKIKYKWLLSGKLFVLHKSQKATGLR